MKHLKFLILLIVSLGLIPMTSAQNLPASPWYAIVHEPDTDTLHWINQAGEQASMQRPVMPNEAQFLRIRIAPNGQHAIIVSRLTNNHDAVGIYDFAVGNFVQIHEAQDGETIHLGSENIFTSNSQFFAIGFMSGDFATPEWRVILFETATGTSVAFIDHTFPNTPEIGLSAPLVQYIDGGTVHFVFQPQAVGGWIQNYAAYAWQALGADPAQPILSESLYNRPNVQVLPLTGEIASVYMDEAYPITPPDGQTPNYNAVGRMSPANDVVMTPVHAGGTRYLLKARWANGGEWILVYSMTIGADRHWGIMLANGTPGNNSYMPFDPQYTAVFGTSDGYLVMNNVGNLSYTNGFTPNTALNVYMASPNATVIYVTPMGSAFNLSALGGNSVPIAIATPTNAVVVTPIPETIACTPAQTPRVAVGIQARVLTSMGALNVRQEANGALINTLAGGATFTIIDGPQCIEGLYWWQIQRPSFIGWVAEATAGGYFIEPYDGPASDGLVATDTPVPPVVEVTPVPPPVEVGCEQAPATQMTTAMFVTVNSELRPHHSPNGDSIPRSFYQPGASLWVLGGPACVGGQRWWRVSGSAKIGRIGNNFEEVEGWVSEGINGTYYVSP